MGKNDKTTQTTPPEAVISIIGMGMTLTGDCKTDGALRIEGTVIGNVRAGKAVVIGKEGLVDGNIYTQDAVITGRVMGSVHAQSRLELQATGEISGGIEARRMKLEEGASIQGQVSVGDAPTETRPQVSSHAEAVPGGTPEGSAGGQGLPAQPVPGGEAQGRVSVASASTASPTPRSPEAPTLEPSPSATPETPETTPSATPKVSAGVAHPTHQSSPAQREGHGTHPIPPSQTSRPT